MDWEIQINGWALKISLGVIINAILTLISLGVLYGSIDTKFEDALKRIQALEVQRVADFETIITLKNDLSVAIQRLSDFQNDYEHDANRYIRDYNDPRRKDK